MKKQKKLSVMAQLMMLCVIPLVVMVACVTVYAISTMRNMVHDATMEGLENLCRSVYAAYEAIDPGAYRMEGETLYKGDYNVSENVDIIDSFVDGSAADVTLFYGDTRRATSLRDKDTGERILGTKASDAVIQAVINEGKTYETDSVTINGETYYAFYMPAIDSAGKCVGMVFAGQPATEASARINKSSMMILGIAALILIIALLVCIKIASAIARVIIQTEKLLSSLAEGDLNLTVNERILKRTDEIGIMGHAVQRLLEELQNIIGSIKKNTETLMSQGNNLESMASQTSTTADEISSAVEDISKGAVSMAEDIESATGQVANMGAIIEKIADSVKELDDLSNQMHVADVESSRIINELSESNDRTTAAIRKIEASVHTTNESVTRIQDAVNLIASIASETSLLALNASIEAARAGEAGRGFAVVAEQIRMLAEDSANSAETSKKLLEANQKEVSYGNEVTQKTAESLNKVLTELDTIIGEVANIRVASDHQAVSVKQIEKGVKQIGDTIQSNSAASQETSATSEQLAAEADSLDSLVGKFRLLGTK